MYIQYVLSFFFPSSPFRWFNNLLPPHLPEGPPAPLGSPEDKIWDLMLDLYHKQFERDKVISCGHFTGALRASATGRT